MKYEISDILKENKRRVALLHEHYDPITGEGSHTCKRVKLKVEGLSPDISFVPKQMMSEPFIKKLAEFGNLDEYLKSKDIELTEWARELARREYIKIRIRYDFEYWAANFVTIQDKENNKDVKFVLNYCQRILLKEILDDFFNDKPIRIIIPKPRQVGVSTLSQIFMIWIQMTQTKMWHSVIVAHKESTSKVIRGMYTKMLRNYPKWLLDTEEEIKLFPFENSQKTKVLRQRECRITVGSSEQPNGILGDNLSGAHLSEVAVWKASEGTKPEELVQSIISGILYKPMTMIVYESSARGVGNFFHREWLRANSDNPKEKSVFKPLFLAWFQHPMYTEKIKNYERFVSTMDEYEWELWNYGATLEGIRWYRSISRSYGDLWRFRMEYPSTPSEAFQSSGNRFYPTKDVMRLREGNRPPRMRGDMTAEATFGANAIKNIQFKEEERGMFQIWEMPDDEPVRDRYVVVVDIGGRGKDSDRSVICVFDRYWLLQGGVVEVVAEWCGHIDHDLLAWKSLQIAKWYKNALLIIESNTLETEQTEGDHFEYILDEIANYYNNLFCRVSADKIAQGAAPRWGFHTNKSSKQMVCDHQKKALRENMYIEPCKECCDEHDTFEVKDNGSLGAVDGAHDDRHITRAIGIWACYQYMNPPKMIEEKKVAETRTRFVGLSSF